MQQNHFSIFDWGETQQKNFERSTQEWVARNEEVKKQQEIAHKKLLRRMEAEGCRAYEVKRDESGRLVAWRYEGNKRWREIK